MLGMQFSISGAGPVPWAAPWAFPGAIHASPPAPAASYLGCPESLLQADDLVVLVGDDRAEDADALPVILTEALQQFAVVGASPLSQKLPMAGLQ